MSAHTQRLGEILGWQEGGDHPLLIVQYPWGSRGGYLHPVVEHFLPVLFQMRAARSVKSPATSTG